jgi:phosphotransferase system enzyme I (PtsI)
LSENDKQKPGTYRGKAFDGIGASPGIAIGKAFVLDREWVAIPKLEIAPDQVEREVKRLHSAIQETRRELKEMRDELLATLGESQARLLDAHLMILQDEFAISDTVELIENEGVNAEWAFHSVIRKVTEHLSKSDDDYLRHRVTDIQDIERRVIRVLQGEVRGCRLCDLKEQVIVIAHEVSPSDTAQINRNMVLGIATDIGGRTSHSAIMARSMEIPAVVGLGAVTKIVNPGDQVIVDGNRGKVLVNPEPSAVEDYREEKKTYVEFEQELSKIKHLAAETVDGRRIELAANIDTPDEVDSAVGHGADGIGLFRTEYLFITGGSPDEEEQYKAYKRVVDSMKPGRVVFRTVDMGGDKFLADVPVFHDSHTFLGLRGIRLSLQRKKEFTTQVRAMLRAMDGHMGAIMFPLVSSVEEVSEARSIVEEVKSELESSGSDFSMGVEIGTMVETPAAVMIANELAQNVDFFSIGSNDLVQYTLAVDRNSEQLAFMNDPFHPAVLRMIHCVVEAGRENRAWVGLCGEMAGESLAVPLLVGSSLDELSVSPVVLPEIKRLVRSMNYKRCSELFQECLGLPSAEKVRKAVVSFMKELSDE